MNALPPSTQSIKPLPEPTSTHWPAFRPSGYLDCAQRRDRIHAVLHLFVSCARQHQVARKEECLAVAGNRTLLHEVIRSLRDDFGPDAIKVQIGTGYEMTPAAAERVAALLDSTELVDRISAAKLKRVPQVKGAGEAAPEAQARVETKRRRPVAVTVHAAEDAAVSRAGSIPTQVWQDRMSAERFVQDVFAEDESDGARGSILAGDEAAPEAATGPASDSFQTGSGAPQHELVNAVLRAFAAHALQHQVFPIEEAMRLGGSEAAMAVVMRCLAAEFGSACVRIHKGIGYEVTATVCHRFADLVTSRDLAGKIVRMSATKGARSLYVRNLRDGNLHAAAAIPINETSTN
ncbi:hypothetical protein BH11PSE7_BH11PSE7_05680 [soil metagenome]